MKIIYCFLLHLILCFPSNAQTGIVTGKLKDSASGKPLPLATVTVFTAKDTAMVTYRLSNPDGDFRVNGLPLDIALRMVITFAGYKPLRREFTLTDANSQLSLGIVQMGTTTEVLNEVTVLSERPPVSVRNDTIEFNANAFKTLPNALVEDLLKKLPGVDVDRDGNISVNGKVVNRILVDGKTFFGNDPKMATRNLPANIIDKVQVMDDKEELLRNGDDNINNIGKVVNITLKKGVKKGWFGKVYAGAGDERRNEAGAIANIFRDTLQLSLLGYTNNLNRPGFTISDLGQAGGFNRSNSNFGGSSNSVYTSNSGSGIAINGINFGGLQNGGGISTSTGTGFNLNHAPDLKRSLFAQYFFGNVHVERYTRTDISQYNQDSVIDTRNATSGTILTQAHNMGIGGKFKPDSLTTLQVSANYIISQQDDNLLNNITSTNNKIGPLSTGAVTQYNGLHVSYYRHAITYTRLSGTKKGRRFTIFHNLDINNSDNNFLSDAKTRVLYPSVYDSLFSQLRQEATPKTDVLTAFNYSEPFNKNLNLRLGGRYEYSKLANAVITFNPNSTNGAYDKINTLLSQDFTRENNRFFINAGLEYKWRSVLITPGIRFLSQRIDNVFSSTSASVKQQLTTLLPAVNLVYRGLNLSYNKDMILPGYVHLAPVANNTNPFFISNGNPGLLPAERHSFSASWLVNDTKRNLGFNLNARAATISNDIINSVNLDQKGVQTVTPVNADGTRGISLSYRVSKQYKTINRVNASLSTGGSYNENRSRFTFNGQNSWQFFSALQQYAFVNLNFNDKIEWNSNGSIEHAVTWYSNPAFKKLTVTAYTIATELILRYPAHVIWETHFNYGVNGNTVPGIPMDMSWLNIAVNFTMLKDEKGVLRISMNNVLDRNNNIAASVNRNVVTTTQSNVLGRYLMASFSYTIRSNMGPKKKIGEGLFKF